MCQSPGRRVLVLLYEQTRELYRSKRKHKKGVSSDIYAEVLTLTSALARWIPSPVSAERSRQSWDIIESLSPMKVLGLIPFQMFMDLWAATRS